MNIALPHPAQWADLSAADLEILYPGAADSDGRWTYEGKLVVRIYGLWTMMAEVADRSLCLREARLRLHAEGMAWSGAEHLAFLDLAPEDVARAVLLPGMNVPLPIAPSPKARRDVLLRALLRAIGADARARLEAVLALGRLRLHAARARAGFLKPLEDTPRIIVYRSNGTTATQFLFRRVDGGSRMPPDLRRFLNDGACRQISTNHGEFLQRCDEIRFHLPEASLSRHGLLALAKETIERFDAFGIDVRPWIARRAR